MQVAKELKKILEERYGVIVHLTRTSGNICINGYENLALDSGKISLRGEAAKGMDLFISLHTNANLEHANGVDTNRQPIALQSQLWLLILLQWKVNRHLVWQMQSEPVWQFPMQN